MPDGFITDEMVKEFGKKKPPTLITEEDVKTFGYPKLPREIEPVIPEVEPIEPEVTPAIKPTPWETASYYGFGALEKAFVPFTLTGMTIRGALIQPGELTEGREEANQIIEFLANKGFEVYSKHSLDQYMWIHNPSAAPTKQYNYIFKRLPNE